MSEYAPVVVMVTSNVFLLMKGTTMVREAKPHKQIEEHIFLALVWGSPRLLVRKVKR